MFNCLIVLYYDLPGLSRRNSKLFRTENSGFFRMENSSFSRMEQCGSPVLFHFVRKDRGRRKERILRLRCASLRMTAGKRVRFCRPERSLSTRTPVIAGGNDAACGRQEGRILHFVQNDGEGGKNGFFGSVSAFRARAPVGPCGSCRRAMLGGTSHAFWRLALRSE